MLSVVLRNGEERSAHIQSFIPIRERAFMVEELQADGDELELICQHFSNIPMSKNRVVLWRGEIAIFIAANLPVSVEKSTLLPS